MARGTGTVTVKFLGDVSDLKKKTEDADGALGKIGSSIGGIAKSAALVGGPALLAFGAAALTAFGEAEKVGAQTEAVIKSTGGAAHVTAGQVGELAGSLSQMSGIDDEAIQSGENLLLTFTNVKNGVGAGNDIFNQATQTMLDMSTALGTDATTSAMQLGKALNDPIKGITALRKVGVSFTDDQEKQIKAMVASGNVMGAQKIILAELSKEFGGSAKAAGDTFAGSMNKLKVSAGNFMEDVGSKLAPFIVGFTDALGEGGIGGGITYLIDALKKAWPGIQSALADMLGKFGGWIRDTAWPYLQAQFPVWVSAFWEWIKDVTPPALEALGKLLGELGTWLIGTGLPWLGEKLVELGKALWKWIQDVTPDALRELGDLLVKLGAWIVTDGIPKAVEFMAKLGVKLIDWITDVIPKLPPKLAEFLGKIAAWVVTDALPSLAETAVKLSEKLVGFIVEAGKAAPGKMAEFIGAIAHWVVTDGPGAFKEMGDKLIGFITLPFRTAFNMVAGFWNDTIGKASFHVPDWVPGVGGKGFDFPKMPVLDTGGIVTSPTLAMLAANSRPEAVIPLARARAGAMVGHGGNIEINFYGPQDPAGVARQIEGILTDYKRQGGSLRFT